MRPLHLRKAPGLPGTDQQAQVLLTRLQHHRFGFAGSWLKWLEQPLQIFQQGQKEQPGHIVNYKGDFVCLVSALLSTVVLPVLEMNNSVYGWCSIAQCQMGAGERERSSY